MERQRICKENEIVCDYRDGTALSLPLAEMLLVLRQDYDDAESSP